MTRRQLEVLAYIAIYNLHNHRPPTDAEICMRFGWRSLQAARNHTAALEKAGYLDERWGGHRRYVVSERYLEAEADE